MSLPTGTARRPQMYIFRVKAKAMSWCRYRIQSISFDMESSQRSAKAPVIIMKNSILETINTYIQIDV